jgi:hypothetical protein
LFAFASLLVADSLRCSSACTSAWSRVFWSLMVYPLCVVRGRNTSSRW